MKRVVLFLVPLLALVWACEKDKEVSIPDQLKQKKYYEKEIFPKEYLDIYGKWELFQTIGGFVGQQEVEPGSFLQVVKYGIYGFLEGDSITNCGKIVISEPGSEDLKIKFEDLGDATLEASSVSFESVDTLVLISPSIIPSFSSYYKRVD